MSTYKRQVEEMIGRAAATEDGAEAMRLSQAATNAANALATLDLVVERKPTALTDDLVKRMVDRFLQWRLPEDFTPDCGIHFDADAAKGFDARNRRYEPVGTNLLSAHQAEAMVRHMLAD